MAEKKRLDESEGMFLTPLRLVMGDIPIPDPDGQRKAGQKRQIPDPLMESTVKRLIAHFKDEK
jgi:hypothetical protein